MGKLADALSRPVTNAGRIAAQLRSEIVERRVPAGHRLGVTELAIRFGVSGAPVREALQQLGAEGYLQLLPNKGAVTRIFGPRELKEIFGVREALESFQAERFSVVATDEQIGRLEKIAQEFDAIAGRGPNARSVALNREFHNVINSHDDNAELMLILERHQGVAQMMRHDFGVGPQRAALAGKEHLHLVDALRKRDAVEVRRIAAHHVRGTLADILQCCEARQQRAARA